MFHSLLKSVIGSANDRFLKKTKSMVRAINELEPKMALLSDDELKQQTHILKNEIANGKTLDDVMCEAFATVREASKRVLGMRHFDVQLIGGIVLHRGMIAEMKTGEGKTLMSTLAVYLNALAGKGVHVVTVNDYLAQRDTKSMGRLYHFLDLSVGCIYHGISDEQRRIAYHQDITYGTNHEFGFDYLRDNMKFHLSSMVMRPFFYAIVDEVDSILIDEARTPLIISGPSEDSSMYYRKINEVIPRLIDSDYEIDKKQNSVILTEEGIEHVEQLLQDSGLLQGKGLYDMQNITIVHHVDAALKAHKLFQRDVEYIVKDDEVVIIDEFTGRMMDGRRYSNGLHQGIEAKEGVEIQAENQTLASITYQNFFKLYPKLSGMAGTAMTEAPEFEEIYNLQVVEIPPNRPIKRKDYDDEIYLTADQKYKKVVEEISNCLKKGQPVLVGTTSIEKSELISSILNEHNIKHNVLNARQHEQEAYIIADAGRSGIVTVATNMAGRGTDIQLGGHLEMRVEKELQHLESTEERDLAIFQIEKEIEQDREKVREAGGLFIIGTERHESRRIDNQLRGRSGRQGDPGASKFYISLEDDLMRIFGQASILQDRLRKFGAQEEEVISHKWISKAIERSQEKVEERNFDIRKNLLRYDNVMNDQRKIVYGQRKEIMDSDEINEYIKDIYKEVAQHLVAVHAPDVGSGGGWNFDLLAKELKRFFNVNVDYETTWGDGIESSLGKITQDVEDLVLYQLSSHQSLSDPETVSMIQKNTLLRFLDQHWKDHLLVLDHLRQGINLRSYAQGNPLNEYKREAFNLFQSMIHEVKMDFVSANAHFDYEQVPSSITNRSNIWGEDDEGDHSGDQESNLEDLFGSYSTKDPNSFLQQLAQHMKSHSSLDEIADELGVDKKNMKALEDILLAMSNEKYELDMPDNEQSLHDHSSALDQQHEDVSLDHDDEAKEVQIKQPSSRNSLCPCGSKKRYKHCHGAF
jgi:preprotein translocase subunit SecA